MVKFTLKLENNRIDKWSSYYIDYKKLKHEIDKLKNSTTAGSSFTTCCFTCCGRRGAERQVGSAADGPINLPASSAASAAPATTENTGLLASLSASAAKTERNIGISLSDAVVIESFTGLLSREIDKVEQFFLRKLHALCDRFQRIAPQVTELGNLEAGDEQEVEGHAGVESNAGEFDGLRHDSRRRVRIGKPVLDKMEEEKVRRDLLDLYRDLVLLKNFAIINYTAVVKITKKYDKRAAAAAGVGREDLDPSTSVHERTLRYVHHQRFYKLHTLKEVTGRCVEYFADMFCMGNDAQARGLMLPQKTDERIDLAQFQLGYRMGIAAVLAFWILWDCCFEPYEIHTQCEIEKGGFHPKYLSVMLQPAFPVYRALAGFLLLRWCWGLSTLVWGRTRVNYVYLFEIDPRAVSSPLEVFNNVAAETIIYLANLLIYYKLLLRRFPRIMPPGCLPLILCLYALSQMVYPFRKTWVFWRVIFRVLAGSLLKVDFFATYVADVMTSSVKTTQDLAYTVSFFLSGDFLLDLNHYKKYSGSWQASALYVNFVIPVLCVLPLWLRFQQCLRRYLDTQKRFPHLANCLKYAMAFTVALFGVLTPPESTTSIVKVVWFVMYVVSTLYTFAWDVLQDWGLGYWSHQGLRKKRLFSKRTVYYIAIAADLMLRFNWLYSLIPPGHNPLPFIHSSTLPIFVTTIVTVCELLRRTMWGFFRLENEQINNTEGYRSTRNVPLHFTTVTARQAEPRHKGTRVIGEVVAVTAAGVAMAAVAIVAAKDQAGQGR